MRKRRNQGPPVLPRNDQKRKLAERSKRLGDVVSAHGAAEEAGALTKLKRAADIAGPAAIDLLGGLIGPLFASVLTSLDVPF